MLDKKESFAKHEAIVAAVWVHRRKLEAIINTQDNVVAQGGVLSPKTEENLNTWRTEMIAALSVIESGINEMQGWLTDSEEALDRAGTGMVD